MPDEDDLCGLADCELLDRLFPDLTGPIRQWWSVPSQERRVFRFLIALRKALGSPLWKSYQDALAAANERCREATSMLRQGRLVAICRSDPFAQPQLIEAEAWDGLALRERLDGEAPLLTVRAAPGVSKVFAQKIAVGLISIRLLETAEADPDSTPSGSATETGPKGFIALPIVAELAPADHFSDPPCTSATRFEPKHGSPWEPRTPSQKKWADIAQQARAIMEEDVLVSLNSAINKVLKEKHPKEKASTAKRVAETYQNMYPKNEPGKNGKSRDESE